MTLEYYVGGDTPINIAVTVHVLIDQLYTQFQNLNWPQAQLLVLPKIFHSTGPNGDVLSIPQNIVIHDI